MSSWGKNIRLTVFGASHGKAIGATIDGLPPGINIDMDEINYHMQRRAPGKTPWSTPRSEADQVIILSGIHNDYTTGTPLVAMIENTNQNSKSYDHLLNTPRPSHADYTGNIRYNGFQDIRGGGHFSGRLTAPIVFAGAIAMGILKKKNINIASHIYSLGNVVDDKLDYVNTSKIEQIENKLFPTLSIKAKENMLIAVMRAKHDDNSIGGIIEVVATGMPAGIGSPIFMSLESQIASMMFSVPAVKGVEFGAGFDITKLTGHDANDAFVLVDGEIKTKTNNNGGILGGISSSMPIIVRAAIKPTASINKLQKTLNVATRQECDLVVGGRHDPCIVLRAIPVIESCVALSILDTWMEQNKEII